MITLRRTIRNDRRELPIIQLGQGDHTVAYVAREATEQIRPVGCHANDCVNRAVITAAAAIVLLTVIAMGICVAVQPRHHRFGGPTASALERHRNEHRDPVFIELAPWALASHNRGLAANK